MDPDKFQQAWQAHSHQTRVMIDADLLRKEVQRQERAFRASIFWRDFGEVGTALLMIPVWLYLGITTASPWTWYLSVPAFVWVAAFMLVDRRRQKQKAHQPGESLVHCVRVSLTQVEHQIWLLRNVFWWYLLPFSISITVFLTHVFWNASSVWWEFAIAFLCCALFLIALYGWIYYLNQRAVRMQLEPRRKELLTLLGSLGDETSDEDACDQVSLPALPFADDEFRTSSSIPASPGMIAIAMVGLAALMLFLGFMVKVAVNTDFHTLTGEGYPKRSPFAGVRWDDSEPEVQLGDEWFQLVSLDGLPAAEIVSFSRRTYGERWHKRFEEDLVEILTGMKHPPQDTVTLVVQSLTTGEKLVRKNVPMTYANRRRIRDAAQAREIAEPQPKSQPVMRTAVSIDDTKQFRERIDKFLRLAQLNAGFSGVVVVAQGGEPLYEGTFGYSHLASRIPNSMETPFRITALSQAFTAAAILALEADGHLRVDDPVHRYLPEFAAEPYREITIYQLLTHTSGLCRVPRDEERRARYDAMSKTPTPVDDYVRLACECPLSFKPGIWQAPSEFGYRVLSALIVRVTHDEYADFMQERIFTPLKLKQTGVARIVPSSKEAQVAEVVSLISLNSRTTEPSFASTERGQNYGSEYGNGAIYSSANDLLRWDRALAGDSFLPAEQKAKLLEPFKGDYPFKSHYACGWDVYTSEVDGRLYQTYRGALRNFGYFSRIMRIPEDDLVVIALGNVFESRDIRAALEQLLLLCSSQPYHEMSP